MSDNYHLEDTAMHRQIRLPHKTYRFEQKLLADLLNPKTVDQAIDSAIKYLNVEKETEFDSEIDSYDSYIHAKVNHKPELTLALVKQMTSRQLNLSQANSLCIITHQAICGEIDIDSDPYLLECRRKAGRLGHEYIKRYDVREKLQAQLSLLNKDDPDYPELLACLLEEK